MRKTPDGSREVIEMLVPIEGRVSKVVRYSGMGLRDRIVIGSPDVAPELLLDILNRDCDGRLVYDNYQVLRGGLVPLADVPLQKGDQTFANRGGGTFGSGRSNGQSLRPGEIHILDTAAGPGPTAAWCLTTRDQKALLITPAALNSFELAERLPSHVEGEFLIEMLSAGVMTAGTEPVARGWRLIAEPIVHVPVNTLSFH